jgi:hypothetical protein
MDGWMDGVVDGWMDGWMCVVCVCLCLCLSASVTALHRDGGVLKPKPPKRQNLCCNRSSRACTNHGWGAVWLVCPCSCKLAWCGVPPRPRSSPPNPNALQVQQSVYQSRSTGKRCTTRCLIKTNRGRPSNPKPQNAKTCAATGPAERVPVTVGQHTPATTPKP